MPTLGERIKELRTEHEMTQEEFGKLFGVTKYAISLYENDKSTPNDDIKKKMADYFNVSIDWLMGVSDVRSPLVYEALKDDPELLEFWETMQKREDLQLMFKKSKELTPDAVRKIIEIIKLIEDSEDHEYNRK